MAIGAGYARHRAIDHIGQQQSENFARSLRYRYCDAIPVGFSTRVVLSWGRWWSLLLIVLALRRKVTPGEHESLTISARKHEWVARQRGPYNTSLAGSVVSSASRSNSWNSVSERMCIVPFSQMRMWHIFVYPISVL